MIKKQSGTVGTVFLKGFDVSISGEFIYGGVLIELFAFCIPYDTRRRNEFDINLNPLPGIEHLFIRFRDILWIPRLYRG